MGIFGPSTSPEAGPDEARRLLHGGAMLIDVREQHEWDAGHAPMAEHHPLGELDASLGRLPTDCTIVVVCRSGNRSAHATQILIGAGIDAVNLTGGMSAWEATGLPVVDGRGDTGTVT